MIRILQTGQYFTQNDHFLHNHLSDLAEILTASLYYEYFTLVKFQGINVFHPEISIYRANLGKKGILGPVYKIHDTGRWQEIDPTP